ncbi:rna-directed dna polymerase from mobile element jockey-like [Limosa lapponica baueri]|uniref:Rna-directed dna polymerase from mobile element jockey-like n=1 Tax=Limosa lapponica baueri TaxID=1758121 RepID=A0A2I0T4H7_LIMLA|nr:rna-directed dna polymerase from mobile element jockey-like [Limosa lapponica baueri]
MDGYKLYRRDRQGRECVDCLKFDDDDEKVELFMDVCWKYNNVARKQSRRFLECVEDNFLTQLVREPTREGAPLDLFVNKEGLVGDVMVGSHLGHSDHEMIEFLILVEIRRVVSRTATLDFRKADFGLFRGLVDGVPWEAVLKAKGVQEGWTFFKKEVLKQSWQTGEIPADWRLANVMLIHKKGWKEDLGNYRPVSLTSVPENVMEQVILSAIMWRVQANQEIRPSQHGFMKGRSCLTNL